MIGRVTSVEQSREGVILDGDHAEGVTSLTVVDALDLDAEGGRLVLPGGEVVEHDAFDPEGVTVPLVGALPVPVEDAELLEVYPPLVSTVAYVATDDEDGATPVPVEVPSGVSGWSTLAPGASLRFEVTRAGDLVATDVISGALEVAADQVSEGTIRSEWQMSSDGAIVMGDGQEGEQAVLTSDGLRLFVTGPNGVAYEAVSMTNGVISFGVMGQDGTRLGGISSEGAVSGATGTFAGDVRVKGIPVLGQVGGGTIPGWLDNLPRGVIAYEERPYPAANPASTGFELYHLHCTVTLLPGRRYRVVARGQFTPGSTNSAVTVRIRHAPGTGKPPKPSPQVGEGPEGARSTLWCGSASPNQRVIPQAEGFITVPTEQVRSFVMTYVGDYGATPLREMSYIFVEDVGPVTPQVSGGSEDGGNAVLYQATWQATATRRYYKSGEAMPSEEDGKIELWYWHGVPTDFKNVGVLFSGGAVEATDSIEMGKTFSQALNGATIHKSEIFLKNKIWNSDDEGYLALSSLSGTSLPSWKTIDSTFWGGTIEAGEGVWVEVPTSWFTNGANQGFCIGDKDGRALDGAGILNYLRSGSFHGLDDTDPPLVRHTYSR